MLFDTFRKVLIKIEESTFANPWTRNQFIESYKQVNKYLNYVYNDPTKYRRFVVGIDRARMKLYDVEESAQADLVAEPIPDKPINKFGDRETEDTFANFKI